MEKRLRKGLIAFLHWFCRPEYLEEIEGDIMELYEDRRRTSVLRANLLLVQDVLFSCRPVNFKKFSFDSNLPMLLSYVTTGFRSLRKDFGYTLVNLIGLSVALSLFILMIMVERHENSFDRFHSNSDRVFQVIQVFQNADGDDPEIFTALPLANALETELGVVEKAVSVHGAASSWVRANGKKFFEEDGIVAGNNFFDLFDFPLVHGDKKALDSEYSIVITESLALKYFNHSNCIGKVIDIERYGLFTVSAVMEDVPDNSTMQFKYIITQNYETFLTKVAPWFAPWFNSWQGDPAATFVMLNSKEEKLEVEQSIGKVVRSHIPEDQLVNDFYLIPLNELHYGLNGVDGRINEYRKGDKAKSNLLILVASIVLAMGCFNYLNIVTARLARRSREVGLRKAIGANRGQISKQFFVESFLLISAGMTIAVIIAYYFNPIFARVSGLPDVLSPVYLLKSAPIIIGLVVLITLIAGAYPALYLSRLATTEALKISGFSIGNSAKLRNVLVSMQFGLALAMVISLFIINRQYKYMRDKDLGFDTDKLAIVEVNGAGVRSNYELIKTELISDPSIIAVTGLTRMISGYRTGPRISLSKQDSEIKDISSGFYGIDANGPTVLGFDFIAGTTFSAQPQKDSSSIILNRAAAEILGGISIIGEEVTLTGDDEDAFTGTVIGVVENFHTQSLHEEIGPVVIGYLSNPFQGLDDIVIKIDGKNIIKAIETIEKVHHKYDENDVITFEFLDDMVQRSYKAESDFRNVLIGASVLGIIIAILGMIGLTAYLSETRSKEIGIRKVLGASLGSILLMQSRSFVLLMVIAMIVTCPLIWFLAEGWLSKYAYRIQLTPDIFVFTVMALLLTTTATISVISLKTITRNPAETLRTD